MTLARNVQVASHRWACVSPRVVSAILELDASEHEFWGARAEEGGGFLQSELLVVLESRRLLVCASFGGALILAARFFSWPR